MSKRRRSDDEGGPRSLHLVLDDWSKGYSIYKVDVADLDGADPGADLDALATPLPGPPVFRLESCHLDHCSNPWFSSFDGRIAMTRYNEEEDAPVLFYDTTTGGLAVGPRVPSEARFADTYIPNGAQDRLYLMGTSKFHRRGEDHFEVLAADEAGRLAWSHVPTPPFRISKVACHAAHPDGRTIFFSLYGGGTYSFDAETQVWRRHGDWMLPFEGRVYYDAQLDSWVGLNDRCDGTYKGDVRCCDVLSPTVTGEEGPPAWKTVTEKMVCEDWERTNKVALTHMGRIKFCLVEQRFRKGVNAAVGDNVYLFYVTTFKLRYDKDGGLRAADRRTRCYTMPSESTGYSWWAFGI